MTAARSPQEDEGSGSGPEVSTDLYGVQTLAEMSPGELLRLYEEEEPDRIEAAAPVGHWTIELDGRQMTWSQGFQRLLGTDGNPDWETGEELRRIVHPEDREAFDAALRKAIADREQFQLEHRISRPGGGTSRMRSAGAVQSDPEEQVDRIFGITHQLGRSIDEG